MVVTIGDEAVNAVPENTKTEQKKSVTLLSI